MATKKIISILLLLSSVLTLCACNQGASTTEKATTTPAPTPPKPTPFPVMDSAYFDIGGVAQILKNHVNPSIEELVPYSFQLFNDCYPPRGKEPIRISAQTHELTFMNLWCPIEYIGTTNDDTVYVIYKLTDDITNECVYTYRFFQRNFWESRNKEYWEHSERCEVYYLTDALSYNDFAAGFSVGNTLEDAISISAGLKYDIDGRYDYSALYYDRPEIPTQTCFQLLEDGVLVLRFEANCTTDKWEAAGKPNSALICTAMEFYPNGTPATVDGIELTVLTAPADKRPPLPKGE